MSARACSNYRGGETPRKQLRQASMSQCYGYYSQRQFGRSGHGIPLPRPNNDFASLMPSLCGVIAKPWQTRYVFFLDLHHLDH